MCARGYVRHSEAAHAAGHDDVASSDLAKADQFAPDDLRIAVARAVLRLSRQGPGSPERLRQALRDTPDDIGVNVLHAQMSLSGRKYDDAIADASHVIALRPGAAAAYELRATARFAKSDIDGATADVNKALELAPKSPDGLRLRASVTTVSGRYADALADLELAHRLEPRADDPFLQSAARSSSRASSARAPRRSRSRRATRATARTGCCGATWRSRAPMAPRSRAACSARARSPAIRHRGRRR